MFIIGTSTMKWEIVSQSRKNVTDRLSHQQIVNTVFALIDARGANQRKYGIVILPQHIWNLHLPGLDPRHCSRFRFRGKHCLYNSIKCVFVVTTTNFDTNAIVPVKNVSSVYTYDFQPFHEGVSQVSELVNGARKHSECSAGELVSVVSGAPQANRASDRVACFNTVICD